MKRLRWISFTFVIALAIVVGFTPSAAQASALVPSHPVVAPAPPPGPDRFKAIVVQYTAYEWWLTRWSNNDVVCQVIIDHEGIPTLGEIYTNCEEDIYNEWEDQQPCPEETLEDNPHRCPGYYINFLSTLLADKEITVTLPPPMVWVSLDDCIAISALATNLCEYKPILILTGAEPLPNETILSLEGTFDGERFTCDPVCIFELEPTNQDGIILEFWAYSSYGDSSEKFTAQIRVTVISEDNPDEPSWYVDVLSRQWAGQPTASCAETWQTFPPVGGPPPWLTTPQNSEDLATDIPYSYLAGNLILQGIVDASDCPGGGLLSEGGANPCGLDISESVVVEWQNRFDALILDVANEAGIPAQLIKNLFARESQFWPGIFKNTTEVGLGQLTKDGADTTLLWNPSFFEQFCPLILPNNACRKGYIHLNTEQQEILRAALVGSADVSCPDCPFGLDLSQADFSVNIFANTLLANCEQAGRIVRNVTKKAPGKAATYEDLWKFTLVNYNGGPGCLAYAIQETWSAKKTLDWSHVSGYVAEECPGAIDYVNDISQ